MNRCLRGGTAFPGCAGTGWKVRLRRDSPWRTCSTHGKPSPALEVGYDGLHYCLVELSGDAFQMAVRSPDGDVIDRVKITKSGGLFDKATMDRAMPTPEAWEVAHVPHNDGAPAEQFVGTRGRGSVRQTPLYWGAIVLEE